MILGESNNTMPLEEMKEWNGKNREEKNIFYRERT
jgi:hypothetical protein